MADLIKCIAYLWGVTTDIKIKHQEVCNKNVHLYFNVFVKASEIDVKRPALIDTLAEIVWGFSIIKCISN